MTLNICYALSLGQVDGAVIIVNVISVVIFYCAHWSTYCTGQLRFARWEDVRKYSKVSKEIWTKGGPIGPNYFSSDIFHITIVGQYKHSGDTSHFEIFTGKVNMLRSSFRSSSTSIKHLLVSLTLVQPCSIDVYRESFFPIIDNVVLVVVQSRDLFPSAPRGYSLPRW